MPPKLEQATRLARRLRNLRESTWPERQLTQAQLAKALSSEGHVATATVSSWESAANPRMPSESRIRAYARFFATERSLDGGALLSEDQLTPDELERFRQLESELLELFHAQDRPLRQTFQFDAGPVLVICPDLPDAARGPLDDEKNANFTKMQQFGDLDALIELYGHLRATNPTLEVLPRLASEVVRSVDLSSHVILLGGIGWNKVTRHIQSVIDQVPITQIAAEDFKDGEIFRVEVPDGERHSWYPEYADLGNGTELIADVAYLARLSNPFRVNRTLTICDGILSHGVLGAVRCLTDPRVREENEEYLANRFPDGEFAMLLRVRVVDNAILPPALQDDNVRLYEWAPPNGGASTSSNDVKLVSRATSVRPQSVSAGAR